MPVEEFIINTFCLVDDLYHLLITMPLRRRGPAPKLSDSEVITMEIVGEWSGRHHDNAIWRYFRQHWTHLFPQLSHRTQFVRQAANLWAVKQRMHQYLVQQLQADASDCHLVDGFPMDVCVRTRAPRSQIHKDKASYGYCASKKTHFYGFHGHLLTDGRGIPVRMTVTAANMDERNSIYELLDGVRGLLIGDKGYIRPQLQDDCAALGIDLQTPLRKNMTDKRPKQAVSRLMKVRRRIETTIGQLVKYFDIEHVYSRDRWHLTSRIARKLLGFTVGVFFNCEAGRELTVFDGVIPTV